MIISEKQVTQLIQVAHNYLRITEQLYSSHPDLLSDCGKHNRIYVAQLLQEIALQQSEELKVIE